MVMLVDLLGPRKWETNSAMGKAKGKPVLLQCPKAQELTGPDHTLPKMYKCRTNDRRFLECLFKKQLNSKILSTTKDLMSTKLRIKMSVYSQKRDKQGVSSLGKCFSTWGDLASQGTFSNVQRHLCPNWGSGCYGHLMVRNQGCCPTSYTTQSSPIIKNHLAPNVNSARVDKLEVRERIPHWREWNEHTYAQY